MKRMLTLVAVLALVGTVAAADWPEFRGAERDGKSAEKGLMQSWPEGGPKEVWNVGGLGTGYSSVAVVGGQVYATGHVDGRFAVTKLDKDGKKLWQTPVDQAKKNQYTNARSTATVDGNGVYVLSDNGTLACLRASDGKEVWKVDILKTYGAPNITWALAESPLVYKKAVIVCPGGRAAMVALDKTNGNELWAAPAVDDKTAYASVRIISHGGVTQAVGFSAKHVFGVHADSGKLLWKAPHETSYDVNATSVVFDRGVLYAVSGYGTGGEAFKMNVSSSGVTVTSAWKNKDLDDQFGGVVLVGDTVIGTGHKKRGITAVKLGTGETVYTKPGVGQASLIYADGRIYCQGHNGEMALVNPADGSVVSKFKLEGISKQNWSHPAISDGKLYVRWNDRLAVYDIKAR